MAVIKLPPRTSGAPIAFLTIRELAARWKLSTRSIHRLIAEGRLPAHRIGRPIRLALTDVLAFEAQTRVTA